MARGKKSAGKSGGGEIRQPSTGTATVSRPKSRAQLQRQWAQEAAERWARARSARKAVETKRRKALARIERVAATEALQSAQETAKANLIVREAENTVAHTKEILQKQPVNQAEQTRQRRALELAAEELTRLREERLSPAEVTKIKIEAQTEIKLGREMVEQAVLDYYAQAKAEGRIERISRYHKPGTIKKVGYRERYGVVSDRRSGKLLSEQNLEETLHSMMRAAESVGRRQPGGKLYATFSYFEYGKNGPRSGYLIPTDKSGDLSKGSAQDAFGHFYQSFDATNYLGGAEDTTSLQIKLRAVLERKLQESAGKNAAVLIGFQMKSYIERNDEERREFDRAMWRKLKAAQRRAEKKGEKATWIDLEKITKD